MHFINVSTGLLLLNAFLSTTAIPVRPQAAVLEVRTLPVDTVGSQAKLAELQEMKTISQGPQAQANGFAPPEYWDGEIARVSKLLEITRGLKTKRDLQVWTSRTVTELKAVLADIKRLKEESEKEGANAKLPPSYWDSQWNAVNRILQIVEGAKTPKTKRELEDRAAPVVISFEAALAKLKQAKIRSEQERSWPPPTYWAREIKHAEHLIAIHKSLKAGAPKTRDLEARAAPLEAPILALKNFYNAQRKELAKLHIVVLEEKLAKLKLKESLKESKGKSMSFKSISWNRRVKNPRKLEITAIEEKLKNEKASYEKYWPSSPQPHKPDLEARQPPAGMAEAAARLKDQLYFGTYSASKLSVSHFEKEIGSLKAKAARLQSEGATSVSDRKALKITNIRIHTAEKGLAKARATEQSGPSSPHKRYLEARGPPLPVPGTAANRARLKEEFYAGTKIAHVTALELLEEEIARLKIQAANLQNKPEPSWLDGLRLRFKNAQIVSVENVLKRLRAKESSSPEGPSSSHKRDLEARGAPVPGAAASSERLGEKLYFGTKTPYMASLDLLEGEVRRLKMQAAKLQNKAAPSWIERQRLNYWNQKVVTAEKALENFRAKGLSSHKQDIEARGLPSPGTAEYLARLKEDFNLGKASAHVTSLGLLENQMAQLKIKATQLQGKVEPSFYEQLLLTFTNRQVETVEKAIAGLRAKGPSPPHKRDLEARASVLSPDQAARLATAIKSLQASSNKLAANRNRVPALVAPLKSLDTSLQKLHKSLLNLQTKAGKNVALQPVSKKPPVLPLQKRDLEARGPSPNVLGPLMVPLKSVQQASLKIEIALLKENIASSKAYLAQAQLSPPPKFGIDRNPARAQLRGFEKELANQEAKLAKISWSPPHKRGLEARGPTPAEVKAAKERLNAALDRMSVTLNKFEIGIIEHNLANNKLRASQLQSGLTNKKILSSSEHSTLKTLSADIKTQEGMLKKLRKQPHKRSLEVRTPPLHVLEENLAKANIEVAHYRTQAKLPGASKEARQLASVATLGLIIQEAKVARLGGKAHKRSLEERSLPLLKPDLRIHLLDLESMRTTSLNRGQHDAVNDFDDKIRLVKSFLYGGPVQPQTPKGLKPPKAEKGKAKASTSSSKR
ncbi:hypothetical protein HYALB_00009146 [Hymenoscyphus albidus]|uniref:Uncharacterized protein n=1 Tax=Hymenoscyphus albidus TaxID=595503 RepID=A0A9N9LTN8_9HELO|nr:hypothetical protein HYALB_00009146 [Hymenoscyphus albidus]